MVVSAPIPQADTNLILQSLPDSTASRTTSPLLVMTVGLPGSGKSTFSRRLAPLIDAVVLESDAARRLLVSVPLHTSSEDRRLWSAIHKAERRLLADGVSLILDATNVTEANRRPNYEIAELLGARLVIVAVGAQERVIAQRLTQREREERAMGGSTDWYDVYRRMEANQEPIERKHLSIDTSDPSAFEAGFWRVVEACGRVPAGQRTGGRS
jgi:predicted kinase